MNTEETWRTNTDGVEQSLVLALKLGRQLKGGEIIELASDLGGGKTTFVRGLTLGIGSVDNVTSPTFTLSNVYKGTSLQLHHYDFYRLQEAGVMGDELEETINDSSNVTVVEWAGIVDNLLPTERLRIDIAATAENENSRSYVFTGTGRRAAQLIRDLQ